MIIIGRYPRNRRGTASDSTVNTINSIQAGLRIKSGLLSETPTNNRTDLTILGTAKISRINEILFLSNTHGELTETYQFLGTQTQAIHKQKTHCLRLYCVNCTTERVSLNLLHFHLHKSTGVSKRRARSTSFDC